MKPYYEQDGITIYHGDCREFVPSLQCDAVVTDPPYKLSQECSASVDADNLVAVASIGWIAPMLSMAIKPGGCAAVFYDTRILPLALEAFQKGGWRYLRNLTLYRRWGQASKLHGWMSTSDFVLLFQRPGAPEAYHGNTYHDVYVKAGPEIDDWGHPAQKPIEFVCQLVANLAAEGETVLDPYMGSGTTLAAARKTGRMAIGIEREEKHCEAAARRVSGLRPESDGSQGALPMEFSA